jgi:hypothetical protein
LPTELGAVPDTVTLGNASYWQVRLIRKIPGMTKSALTAKDLEKLREAITFFEHPSLLMKLANLAGLPAQKLLEFVPALVTKSTNRGPSNIQ